MQPRSVAKAIELLQFALRETMHADAIAPTDRPTSANFVFFIVQARKAITEADRELKVAMRKAADACEYQACFQKATALHVATEGNGTRERAVRLCPVHSSTSRLPKAAADRLRVIPGRKEQR